MELDSLRYLPENLRVLRKMFNTVDSYGSTSNSIPFKTNSSCSKNRRATDTNVLVVLFV